MTSQRLLTESRNAAKLVVDCRKNGNKIEIIEHFFTKLGEQPVSFYLFCTIC